jgi:hypothetical protein
VLVAGSPISAAAASRGLGALPPGEAREVAAVVVDADLVPRDATIRVQRLAEGSWRFLGPGLVGWSVDVDPDGLPRFERAMDWPLEIEESAGPA